MIYHFCGTSPYITKYIDFLKSNRKDFNLNNHHFIINDTNTFQMDQATLQDIKYSLVKSKWGFIPLLNKIKKNDSLIIHGLFNPRLLIYFYLFNRRLVERCIWSIWGGDVYFFRLKNDSCKNRVIEYLRKQIIPHIPVITTLVKGDYDIVKDIYNTSAKLVYSFYPYYISDDESVKNINKDQHCIMVGNSGDPSNNHEQVFNILKKFKNEQIKIICPLSYGVKDYIEKTITLGQSIFGAKFIPLTEFIEPDEYMKILSDIDIAIMNHNRQQGLGSIINLIVNNAKVFIRSDTTSYKFFRNSGIVLFDTLSIDELSYEEFISDDKTEYRLNREKILKIVSEDESLKGWLRVFQEVL
ncbi:MAG: TDP-N-acetylfucosamine:lipid II N-acetylfucosaminyltransferase [Pseudomonadota bacterium]|nr:TDP-N-acetylfucosamine:lipid II N-acetylfucosaminyltransferase [Pseudomonadota bacterium]